MLRQINIKNILWIDWVNISKAELQSVVRHYNFHELDIEACLEENQKARIDYYDDYMFITLHFPKYNTRTQIYELNEFDIFLWKDYIITFRNHVGNHIDKIFEQYNKLDFQEDSKIKITSGYILYEIVQAMLVKMFLVNEKIRVEVRKLERDVFSLSSSFLVKDIMIKKRNIIMLKNMFKPQIVVLNQLEFNMNKLFSGKMEAYFEDLEDKLWKIVDEINLLDEYVSSIEVSYKTMIDIKTNSVIKLLTFFSAFLFPLNIITSYFWMNIDDAPFNHIFVNYLLLLCAVITIIIWYFFFKTNNKI